MRKSFATLAAILPLLFVSSVAAQPPVPKPGPEHELFKKFEGVWDAKIEAQGHTSKGIMRYKIDLGGLWLLEHFDGEAEGGLSFEGLGATSYDSRKKKYVGVWIDSMSTVPMNTTGTYNKKTKTLTSTGKTTGPDGKAMKLTMTTTFKDADNMVFVMTAPGKDGKKMQMMKITYKRKSK